MNNSKRKFTRKPIFVALCVVLSCVMTFAVTASIYYSKQARMSLFSGSIEQTTTKPTDPKLVLKVADMNVGQDGNVSVYNQDVFPILGSVTGTFSETGFSDVTWRDDVGRQPISAPGFVLATENGDINDVTCKMVVEGNPSVASALRFGIVTEYISEADNCRIASCQTASIDPGRTESSPEKLGDGNIVQNEEIKVSVVAWVDSYTLAELGEYENMPFNVRIVFMAP